jgi:c-di-GMP-binding flagellar brake protein YcgR
VQVRNRREEGDRVAYGLEFVRMSDEFRRDIRDFVLASLA